MKKQFVLILILLLVSITLVQGSTNTNATTTMYNTKNVNGYLFNGDTVKNEVITLDTESTVKLENFNSSFNNGQVNIDLVLCNKTSKTNKLNFELDLYSSTLEYNQNRVLVGIQKNNSENEYLIANFRLEKEANSISLLEPNLHMKGKTILNLGIYDSKSNDIYYFQIPFYNFNFNNIYEKVIKFNNLDEIGEEKLAQKEIDYLLLDISKLKFNKDKKPLLDKINIKFIDTDINNLTDSN